MATDKNCPSERAKLLEEIFQESLEREREFVRREQSLRQRIMLALGRVKVMAPIVRLESPTGRTSKCGELMRQGRVKSER